MQGCEIGGKVGDARAVQDGGPKGRGFPRVVAPGRTETAADQGDGAKAIPQAHLAESIDDPQVGGRPLPGAAQGRGQAVPGGTGGDLGAAVGVTGGDQDEGFCVAGATRGCAAQGGENGGLILGVGGGNKHRLAADQRGAGGGKGLRVGGQRRRCGLERACRARTRCAKCLQVVRRGIILRGHKVEAGEEIGVQALPAAAAGIGVGVHPGVDKGKRDAAPRCGHNRAGPEVLFRPDRQRRAPVIQKFRQIAGGIQRQELVAGAGGKVRSQNLGRSARGRGDEESRPWGRSGHGRHKAAQGQHLAQTHGMQPDHRAVRARGRRLAQLFAPTVGQFLALGQTTVQQQGCHKRNGAGRRKIDPELKAHGLIRRHGRPFAG